MLSKRQQSINLHGISAGDKIAHDRISRREMARECSVRVMSCGTNSGLETIAVHSYCCQRLAHSPDKGPQ